MKIVTSVESKKKKAAKIQKMTKATNRAIIINGLKDSGIKYSKGLNEWCE